MAEKQNNKEHLKDITDSIETGIVELFESDKYKSYLQTMSRFHKYSLNNTLLISQIPMFRVVSVFDVSQTEGEPLPTLASNLTGNVEQFEVFMEAVKRTVPQRPSPRWSLPYYPPTKIRE